MTGKVKSDPLFIGLTRPTLIFGVSVQFAMLNMMVAVISFIQTTGISILFIAFATHMVGYILCFKEPRFMELYLNKGSKCNQCPNRSFYGANSYSI